MEAAELYIKIILPNGQTIKHKAETDSTGAYIQYVSKADLTGGYTEMYVDYKGNNQYAAAHGQILYKG